MPLEAPDRMTYVLALTEGGCRGLLRGESIDVRVQVVDGAVPLPAGVVSRAAARRAVERAGVEPGSVAVAVLAGRDRVALERGVLRSLLPLTPHRDLRAVVVDRLKGDLFEQPVVPAPG